jgi:hypothetical protein
MSLIINDNYFPVILYNMQYSESFISGEGVECCTVLQILRLSRRCSLKLVVTPCSLLRESTRNTTQRQNQKDNSLSVSREFYTEELK